MTLRMALPLSLLVVIAGCPEPTNTETFDANKIDKHDAGPLDVGGADARRDAGQPDTMPPGCDVDRDGYMADSCGGDDCDDRNAYIHVGGREVCSFADENCDGANNEGLDCTFVAASSDTIYRIDPFAHTVEQGVTVDLPDVRHGLLDIDIDEHGLLLGVTRDGLYTISAGGTMTLLANVATPTNTNGMAIDSAGTVFITNSAAVDSKAYTVSRTSGVLTELGALSPYVSSGDCVSLKDDSLLMTAPDPDVSSNPPDLLVYVDSRTAATRRIGATGFSKVFGLSASFGFLFGVTDQGEVIALNPNTGVGTLLFTASNGEYFWGAANGD